MTRVLLCHQPTDGGVGRHVRDIACGLTAHGHEVVLCGPSVPQGLTAPIAHVALDLRRAVAPRADAAAVIGFAKIVRNVRPDVIHAHSSKAGAIARLARAMHPRVPLVYTPHGYAFAGYFSRSAERFAYRAIERALAPIASRVVCVCEAEARVARSIGADDRVRVIHNGIGPAGAGPVDARIAKLSDGGPVIGALTLLRPGKGLETLIDATPRVLARHPNAQLTVVGEGPDLGALTARAQSLGVGDAVHFLGPSGDPLGVLRCVDVFVHPSWAEAFPYCILEAMSLGRPVVATDVGGVGEALNDGESGLLVPPRDQAALADALIELLDDPGRRADLGEMALRRVSGQFTREAMIERLVAVYDELVPASPGSVAASDSQPGTNPPTPKAMTSYPAP